jgi:hypothetical protein
MSATRIRPLILVGAAFLLLGQSYNHQFRPRAALDPWDYPEALTFVQGDLGVTTATGVSNWANQVSGGWPDWAQATGADQPTLLSDHFATGKDGIQADASTEFLEMSSAQNTTGDWTLAFVIDDQLTHEGGPLIGSGTTSPNDNFALNLANDLWTIRTNGAPNRAASTDLTVSPLVHDDNPHYYVICNSDSGAKTCTQDGNDCSPAQNDTDDWVVQDLWKNETGPAFSGYILGIVGIWDTDLCADGYNDDLEAYLAAWSEI